MICWFSDIQLRMLSIQSVYEFFYPVMNDLLFIGDAGTQYQVVVEVQVQLSFLGDHQLQEVENIFPYSLLASLGMVDGRPELPTMRTPL